MTYKPDIRNKLAKERDAFMASDLGRALAKGPVDGIYLRNRIESAFLEGYKAAMRSQRDGGQ